MSFCFIVIALCCAGILFCAGQQRVQSEVKVDYARPEYFVTLDSNGGSACAGFKMQLGEYYSVLPTPTRAGYTFKGWGYAMKLTAGNNTSLVDNYTVTSGSAEADTYFYVNKDYKLTAGNQYILRFYCTVDPNNTWTYAPQNDGRQTFSLKNEYNEITFTAKENDPFYWDDKVKDIAHPFTITDARIEAKTSGEKVTFSTEKYITNSTRNTTVGNHTLTAQWSPNSYTVTLYENKNILYGGGLTTAGELKSWLDGASTGTVTREIVTEGGSVCTKLTNTSSNGVRLINQVLSGKIKSNTQYVYGLKVKLDSSAGYSCVHTPATITVNGTSSWQEVFTNSTLDLDSYYNHGWVDVYDIRTTKVASDYPTDVNVMIYAGSNFTGPIYIRDFTVALATNTTKSVTYNGVLGGVGTLSYEGFTFNGYFTQPVGGVQIYTAGGSPISGVSGYTDANGNWIKSGDTKLYGQWTPNNYTYTFDQQSGSGGTSSISVKFNSRTANITVPTRAGYSFGGYYTAANGGGTQYYNASGVCQRPLTTAGNLTLYAKWTANTYTINLDKQGGTDGTSSTSATYNSKLGTITPPVRTGYTFAGYYTGKNGAGTQLYNASGVGQITWTTVGGTTAYAKWTPNTIKITLDKQGGTGGTDSTTATFGSSLDTISIPTRTGYTFAGYYSATGGGGTQYYNGSGTCTRGWDIANATTLYAYWTPNTITITLNKNGGSGGTDTFYYKYGINKFYSNSACTTEITSISLPTRTGYTFSNYYGDGSSGGENGESYYGIYDSGSTTYRFAGDFWTDIYKNAILYAKWNANQYTVTTNLNGGTLNGKSGNATNTIKTDEAMAFGVPTKTGYTFAGWTFSGGTVNSGASYNAFGNSLYSNPAFNGSSNVTVYNNSGNGTVTHSVVQGSAPNNTGYYLEITTAGEATPGLGGYTHRTSSYANAVFTTVIIAKIPVGYSIAWASNATGDGRSYEWLTSELGTGTWQVYILRLKCGASGTFSSTNFYYLNGTAGTTENPVKWQVAYSQVFDSTGASSNSSNTAQILTCTGGANITATANWTANTYTVTYNANGGSGTTANSTHTYDSAKALTKNGFSRTGYTFDGWATTSTGAKVYSDQQSVTNLATSGTYTLYAHWNPNQYTLTLDKQGGSGGSGSATATFDSTVPSISVPSKTGYTFAGYYTATNGGGTQYYNASGSGTRAWTTAGGQTLYAYWTPNTIKITLDKQGGTGGTDTFYYKYGINKFYSNEGCTSEITAITKPTKTGYTLANFHGDGSCGGSNGEQYVAYGSTNFASDLCTDIYQNATLYASWTANEYTLKINYTVPRCGTCNATGTSTHWSQCSTCGGKGTYGTHQETCGTCNGDKGWYENCSWCNGTGTTSTRKKITCPTTETCSECNGTGTIKDSASSGAVAVCPICDGTGSVTCSTCKGKGYYYETVEEDCSWCNGTGHGDWTDCGTCSGTGSVSVPTTCSSCNGKGGENVTGTCGTCSGNKTNFSGGTTSVNVTYGQTLPSITIKSFTGYDVTVPNYSSNGTSTATWTTEGNATWNASFSAKSYTMTLNASSGSWSGYASGTTSVPFGTSVSLTFTNTTGYDNKSTSISGYVSSSGGSSASVSFVMPAQNITISGSGSGSNNSCLAYNTPILTANGWKMIQDITYADRLVRFNHDTGQIDTAYASWISKAVVSKRVMEVTFSDGETIRFVGDHAVFSLDQNKYVAVTDPSKFTIGTRVLKYIANDCANTSCSTCSSCTCSSGYENCATWGEAVVTGICYIEEETPSYSIITSGMWNCFAGNILTTVPNTIIFQNMYGFKKNLTYASSIRQKVLNGTYDNHLFTEKELKDMGWTDRDIVGFRGREWKILIDNGMLDMDFMINILLNEVANNENERILPPVNENGKFVYIATNSEDVINDNFNPQDFFFEEYTHYILPNIKEEGFVGWLSSSDGKIYKAGDTYKVRTNTHFTAIYST